MEERHYQKGCGWHQIIQNYLLIVQINQNLWMYLQKVIVEVDR